MIPSNNGITKALISLRGCAGWSAPWFFANPEVGLLASMPKYSSINELRHKISNDVAI